MLVGSRGRALVPSRMQSVAESIYGFGHKMIEDVAGKEGAKYFPYIMTLFLFILFANVLALIPASFAPTSHIAVTALLALAVFITVTAIGFYKHGAHFLNLFWVKSAPTVALRIVLAVIEVHLLLRAPAQPLRATCRQHDGRPRGAEGLRRASPARSASRAFIPILAITAVYGLELMVAVIQAYVFAILTCVYLNDALHPGH